MSGRSFVSIKIYSRKILFCGAALIVVPLSLFLLIVQILFLSSLLVLFLILFLIVVPVLFLSLYTLVSSNSISNSLLYIYCC
nr:MAG TPA: hypothetical protein [Crassvirales sp.]